MPLLLAVIVIVWFLVAVIPIIKSIGKLHRTLYYIWRRKKEASLSYLSLCWITLCHQIKQVFCIEKNEWNVVWISLPLVAAVEILSQTFSSMTLLLYDSFLLSLNFSQHGFLSPLFRKKDSWSFPVTIF